MSFYSMAFMGMVPLGSLLAGTLAHFIGAPLTVILGGVCCMAGAAVFATGLPTLRKFIRPIYVQKGIIHEVAEGLQSAAGLPPQ
jgi:hypothetical protein